MFHHVLVALDGAPQAELALPLARTLAKGSGAAVSLVHVMPEDGSPFARASDMTMRDKLGEHTRQLAADGVQATATLRFGSAAKEIAEVVRANNCDVVLMATRHRLDLDGADRRGVVADVLRDVDVPVLLLVPADHARRPMGGAR